jgi:GntR family transcriptional regulator
MASGVKTKNNDLILYANAIGIKLDNSSSIPRYHQLCRILSQFIRTQNLPSGYRFPSEDDIANCFKVSRPTVQKAIQELVNRGWLIREKGKGTFIREVASFSLAFFGDNINFTEQFASITDSNISLIRASISGADNAIAAALNLQKNEPVVNIRRLFQAYNHPVMVVDSKLSSSRFPGIEKNLVTTQDLYAVLENNYNLVIKKTNWRIEASEVMEEELADLLQVSILSPVLLLNTIRSDEKGDPIEQAVAYVNQGINMNNFANGKRTK